MKFLDLNVDSWRSVNNEILKNIISTPVTWTQFLDLLNKIQSLPHQSMVLEAELIVLDNMLISHWLTADHSLTNQSPEHSEEEIRNTSTETLLRIIRKMDPALFVDHETKFSEILEKLLESKVYQYLNQKSLVTLMEIASLMIQKYFLNDPTTVECYLKWIKMMKITLEEVDETVDTTEVFVKINMSAPALVKNSSEESMKSVDILQKLIQISSNNLVDDVDGKSDFKDMILHAALHLKQGNTDKLKQVLDQMRRNSSQQPESITILCLTLRAEMLLQMKKTQHALNTFR